MDEEEHRELNYWLNEVHEGLIDRMVNRLRLGRAFCAIHGTGRIKTRGNQLWKQDALGPLCATFTEFCAMKWGNYISWRSIYRYMNEYREWERREQRKALPTDEAKLLALNELKADKDRDAAIEMAKTWADKKGEEVTLEHVEAAVDQIKAIVDPKAHKQITRNQYKKIDRQRDFEARQSVAAQQCTVQGVDTRTAYERINKYWNLTIKDYEEGAEFMAKLAVEFLYYRYKTAVTETMKDLLQ